MPETTYYINGRFIDAAHAAPAGAIPPLSAAFLYGEGVFETVRLYHGRPFRLQEHLRRLEHGLKVLEISPPAALAETDKIITTLLQKNDLDRHDAMIRIVVGAGPAGGNRAENQAEAGSATKSQAETTTKPRAGGTAMAARGTTQAPAGGPPCPPEAPPIIVIQALSLDLAAIHRRQEGMTAMTLPWRRDAANPLLKIKSISYLENRHGLRNARRAGADEGIFLNRNGDITEGTFTNLFFIRGDGLVTPPPDAGLLPGITRQTIIELARELGLDCREATVPHAARGEFDGVFLTSSLTEIAPLTILDDIRYAPTRTAAIRQRLLDAYHKLVGQ